MKNRNKTTYRATFSQLRLHAFGIQNTVDYVGEIEIYQARVSPELWRARPTFRHGEHDWEAPTAELLQAKIAADFEHVVQAWRPWILDPQQVRRPQLVPERSARDRKVG